MSILEKILNSLRILVLKLIFLFWPRLFPDNNSSFNEEGVDFYNRLLDEIFNNDLEPFPLSLGFAYSFLENRCWENKDTCKHFADYSYFVSQQFGDKFDKVTTINEPWCISWLSYYLGEHAPGKKT